MLDRRSFLAGTAAAAFALPAGAARLDGLTTAAIRGTLDATEAGLVPGSYEDQSRTFQAMLDRAAEKDAPVFLPAGTYVVSDIKLPRAVRLSGVAGATRIIQGTGGKLLSGEDCELVSLNDLVIDGAGHFLDDQVEGVIQLRRVAECALDNCRVIGSGKHGIALERTSGRVERCTVSGAAEAGIYSVEAGRMRLAANNVTDCSNGGILVHRWQPADDGTMVLGNRVERIAARNGGTGQWGNGINVYQAGNVIIADNWIDDCAFTAIRSNGGNNVQITGNHCSRSGETAIYSEFVFEGAVISANVVDDAAQGISVVNFNQGGRMAVCQGNIVRNLRSTGPYPADPPGFGCGISVEADTTVTGNVIENAPLYGIGIGWGPYMRNVVATGNVVRNAGEGIAVSVVEGTGSAVITDNIIDGAKRGAILGHRWSDVVTDDLARADDSGFANITVARNKVS